jgi:hypothetical protein
MLVNAIEELLMARAVRLHVFGGPEHPRMGTVIVECP